MGPAEHFYFTNADRSVLAQTDDQFILHDWASLGSILDANNLAALKQKPPDLRRYMQWTADTNTTYGSTTNYLLAHRLPPAWGHPPYTPVPTTPFAHPSNFCILINDWPYGLTPDITHLVVWSRTPIAVDPVSGDMTPESRTQVASFVRYFFADAIGQSRN